MKTDPRAGLLERAAEWIRRNQFRTSAGGYPDGSVRFDCDDCFCKDIGHAPDCPTARLLRELDAELAKQRKTVADYYAAKEEKARLVRAALVNARALGASEAIIRRLESELELAEYVRD